MFVASFVSCWFPRDFYELDDCASEMTRWHDCTGVQRDLLKAIADHDREPDGLALRD